MRQPKIMVIQQTSVEGSSTNGAPSHNPEMKSRSLGSVHVVSALWVGVLAISHCGSERYYEEKLHAQEPSLSTGKLHIPLVTTTSEGIQYQLKHAQLRLTSDTSSLSYLTDTEEVISIVLKAGTYALTLEDGWRLVRIRSAAQEDEWVEMAGADLLDDNPRTVTIAEGMLTQVALNFGIPAIRGRLHISIGVENTIESVPLGTPPSGMVAVPAGEFLMGCNDAVDTECDADEYTSQVHVDGFFIDETEVTVAAYTNCVTTEVCTATNIANLPTCTYARGWMDHPITCVDWEQANTYCQWVGKRLPTEVEWEKAARGSEGRKYPWGNIDGGCAFAVVDDPEVSANPGCGVSATSPVGSKPRGKSPYGALDMAGNVFEFTSDWVDTSAVIRGGGWTHGVAFGRTSDRGYTTDRGIHIGFRCAQ